MNNKCKAILTLFSFFLFGTGKGQSHLSGNLTKDLFFKIDSIAVNFPKEKYKDHETLARLLTKGLSDDLSKFRVL